MEIAALAKTAFSTPHELPDASGIYALLDNASRVFYIGSSHKIRSRLIGHDRQDEFEEANCSAIAYHCCENYKELEGLLIARYDPPLNRKNDRYALPLGNVNGMNAQECFERYIEITYMIKALEQEKSQLRGAAVSFIEEYGDHTGYTGPKIRAYNTTRVKYQYSPRVRELELQLKQLKKQEEDDGLAKVVNTTLYPTLRFFDSPF